MSKKKTRAARKCAGCKFQKFRDKYLLPIVHTCGMTKPMKAWAIMREGKPVGLGMTKMDAWQNCPSDHTCWYEEDLFSTFVKNRKKKGYSIVQFTLPPLNVVTNWNR